MTGDTPEAGAESSTGPSHLDGRWNLESVATSIDEESAAEAPATPNVTFVDGAVFGSGGVNRFRGTYETDGEVALTFGGVASTRMAGPPEAMSQESRFFTALSATTAFGIVAGRLELRGAGGETLAVLVRAMEDTDDD